MHTTRIVGPSIGVAFALRSVSLEQSSISYLVNAKFLEATPIAGIDIAASAGHGSLSEIHRLLCSAGVTATSDA